MLIKITVDHGVVVDVETSVPAFVQIVAVDGADPDITSFETVEQVVTFEEEPLTWILRDGMPTYTICICRHCAAFFSTP